MRRAYAAMTALAIALAPLAASGADPKGERAAEQALRLAYDADALFARGRWDESYDRFAAANAVAHSPVFVLYMARCRRNAGRLLHAQRLYAEVAAEPVGAGAPKPFRDAVSDAAAELAALSARIPKVRVTVEGRPPAPVRLRVDAADAAVGEPLPLDPGTHEIVASAGGAAATRSVTLAEGGGVSEVVLSLSSSVPVARRGSLAPAIVALSVGVVGVGVGAVTGALTLGDASRLKDACPDGHCLRSDAEALDRARSLGTVSTIAFVVGGVGLATAGVLFWLRPSERAPAVSIGPGSLHLAGRF